MYNNRQEWEEMLKSMSLDEFSLMMKDKILADENIDELSSRYFQDCFDYVTKLYKSGKQLDLSLMKIYLEDVKGYKNIKMDDFIRTVLLLGFCGFSFKFDDKNN